MDSLHPVVQTYSILAVTLAAGANLSTTIISLPALLHAPSQTLATQWKILYDSGITSVVSLAMTSAAGFATLAYRSSSSGGFSNTKRNLYIAAATAAFGLGPYTRLLMWQNITELETRAKAAGEGQSKGDTHELVKTWGTLNLWRGVMLLTSAGLGVWASVA